mmetsp:Transcript_141744/g.395202  ORF Transcript_141744/g.395202 Transcript_141744/m.395202 type:complete len:203 (+) Transcript_141744:46-654(+)
MLPSRVALWQPWVRRARTTPQAGRARIANAESRVTASTCCHCTGGAPCTVAAARPCSPGPNCARPVDGLAPWGCTGQETVHQRGASSAPNVASLLTLSWPKPSLAECQVMQPSARACTTAEGRRSVKSSASVAKSAPLRPRLRHRGSPTESTTAKLVAKRTHRSPTARMRPPNRVSPSRGRAMSRARSLKLWRAASLEPSAE